MKKLISFLAILLFLCGCGTKDSSEVNYTYEVNTKPADMSGYDGMHSTGHMFVNVTVDELFNVIDNKSSGVFYLGRTNCGCCQTCVKYLNEVATNLNVTIYYIDAYDPVRPITDDETIDKLTSYLYDILAEVDGERSLQTPTVFSVVNGNLKNSLICLSNWVFDDPPTDSQVKKLENKYTEILKPFCK